MAHSNPSHRFQGRLTRRAVLRGLGATIALPFLESLSPRLGAQSVAGAPPIRMAFLFMPNGVHPRRWTPEGVGADFKLSPILEPLARHQSEIQVLSQLRNAQAAGGDGHYAKSANWLTGYHVRKTTGKDLDVGGPSIDQLYAQKVGHMTRLPSLELGTEPVNQGVDLNVNFTRIYGSHISWRDRSNPMPCEINPRLAFDRLFRERTPDDARRAHDTRSVLDLVLEDAHSIRKEINALDKSRLDEYLESIRSVERRIEHDIKRVASGENLDPSIVEELNRMRLRIDTYEKNKQDAGGQRRHDHTEHSRLMLDMIALAFWSDSTRAATFMFANDVSNKNFSFLPGVDTPHHSSSHHEGHEDKLNQYATINTWHTEQFAYLLDRLRSIKEGDGTVLDHSMIMFGSSLRDGNAHQWDDLPIVLAGRANGNLKPGYHHSFEKNTPLCSLYLAMLQKAGVEVNEFGDTNVALPNLG